MVLSPKSFTLDRYRLSETLHFRSASARLFTVSFESFIFQTFETFIFLKKFNIFPRIGETLHFGTVSVKIFGMTFRRNGLWLSGCFLNGTSKIRDFLIRNFLDGTWIELRRSTRNFEGLRALWLFGQLYDRILKVFGLLDGISKGFDSPTPRRRISKVQGAYFEGKRIRKRVPGFHIEGFGTPKVPEMSNGKFRNVLLRNFSNVLPLDSYFEGKGSRNKFRTSISKVLVPI
ncbi:unnamed protein product [Rhizophagus irregularis]|nr:unnamed protein product [Rhizophagus irregularis]